MTEAEHDVHMVLKQAEGRKDNEAGGRMVYALDEAEDVRKGVSMMMVPEVEAAEVNYRCPVVYEEAPVDPGEDHHRKVEDKG
jgi:hypothetical protein